MTSQEFSYQVKIPRERIAVLIGKKGETKKNIQEATKTKLSIDSQEGDVFVSGKEALNLYTAREIIRAIGRGFNPEIAMLLLKQDYTLDIIEIENYANTNNLQRIRGRLIGTEGKARKTLEMLTECRICIYGKTVSIIGEVEKAQLARRAIEGLLKGARHGNLYKWLEKRKTEIKQKEVFGEEIVE
jgi:ribosomal RNA assembly protein